MRKFAVGVMVGCLMSGAVALASANLGHDARFWNKLNRSAKSGYVNGYVDAMQVSTGKLNSLVVAADLFHWKGARKIIGQLAGELSMSGFKPSQLVRQLNALYSNQQYAELELGSAIQLLAIRSRDSAAPASRRKSRK